MIKFEKGVTKEVQNAFNTGFEAMQEKFGKFGKFGKITTISRVGILNSKNSTDYGVFYDNSGELLLKFANKKMLCLNTHKKPKKMKKSGEWSSSHPLHIFRHELGHKYYYDSIKNLAKAKNIEYNKAKKIIDDRIYDYIHERNSDGKFLLNNLSVYSNNGYLKGQYTEVIAEAFSVVENNSIADELTKLTR